MCRPTYYTIAYEINPWMSLKRQANHRRACEQWQRLYQILTKTLRARVSLVPPQPRVPDLVFTANAGLVARPPTNLPVDPASAGPMNSKIPGRFAASAASGQVGGGARPLFIRSNFRHSQRQREEPILERYFRQAGYRIIRLPKRFNFEGEGDALWLGETLLLGFRFRSDAPAHVQLSRVLRARVLPVELADRRFYHLDTCLCPLDDRTVMWFPRAFDRYGRKVIEGLSADSLAVSERDAVRFACNAIVIGRDIVMPSGLSSNLRRALARRGFTIHTVDLSEFLKAGGSAKCLVLRRN